MYQAYDCSIEPPKLVLETEKKRNKPTSTIVVMKEIENSL